MLNFFKRLFQNKETRDINAAMKKRMTRPELRAYIEESVRQQKEGKVAVLDAMKRAAEGKDRMRLNMRKVANE